MLQKHIRFFKIFSFFMNAVFKSGFFLAILLASVRLQGQKIDIPSTFSSKLQQLGLTLLTPLDSDYKDIFVLDNDLQGYDFAIRSKKEKLEIRYIVESYNKETPVSDLPSIRFVRMLSNLASNEENGVIAIHSIVQEDLEGIFHADWGKIAYFKNKALFSEWEHCKLLCLHRADMGTVYVLFLFNEGGIALDNRTYAVQLNY